MKRKFDPYIMPVKTASDQTFLLSSCKTKPDDPFKPKKDKPPVVYNEYYCEVKRPGHFHFSECQIPARPPGGFRQM